MPIKKIEIESWNRKELFYNFLDFEDPFFNICGHVEVTNLKTYCTRHQASFFIHSYYVVLKVVNQIEEFKYRIRGEDVIVHEKIRGSCPIMRANRTFGYGYFDFIEDLDEFILSAEAVIQKVQSGEPFDPRFDEDDLIHSSVIPWVSFTSIEHAKRLNKGDSIPKVVLGKTYQQGASTMMPISVSGHHGLVDGLHAGEFFQDYEKLSAAFE